MHFQFPDRPATADQPEKPSLECTLQNDTTEPATSSESPQPETDQPGLDPSIKPTKETYDAFQRAYEQLNRDLFDAALPNALITMQRRRKTFGYFSHKRFAREDGRLADEIALNPDYLRELGIEEALSVLAHEMVHLWQHHFGKPGRGRYHNREWAAKMKELGLQPTDTGEDGGKETGERVHHRIIPDGLFQRAARKLVARGYTIPWTQTPDDPATVAAASDRSRSTKKSGKRIKYACPQCGMTAWARFEARLMCADHQAMLEPQA